MNIANILIPTWAKWCAAVGLASGLVLTGFVMGIDHEVDRQMEREKKQHAADIVVITKQGKVTETVRHQLVTKIVQIKESSDEIQSRVRDYVSQHADDLCVVPVGFVRGWNDDNSGSVPSAPSGDNGEGSTVKLSDIKQQHAVESRLHKIKEARLAACQDWVAQQYKAANGVELPGQAGN